MIDQKELIAALRKRYDLSIDDASDAYVLSASKGTLTRALVELGLSWRQLGKSMYESLPKWIRGDR